MHALIKLIGHLLHKSHVANERAEQPVGASPVGQRSVEQHSVEQRLAEHRERFRKSLVGVWTAQVGTFPMMNERLTFYADGTGLHEHFSGSGGYRVFFDWQMCGDFCVRLRDTFTEDQYPEDPADGEAEEPGDWYEVRYDFAPGTNDVHDYIALRQISGDGAAHSGFHAGLFDLGYGGEPERTRPTSGSPW